MKTKSNPQGKHRKSDTIQWTDKPLAIAETAHPAETIVSGHRVYPPQHPALKTAGCCFQ
ncbi:hypothetical protein IH992_24840 [Candidatus Poribacteria bacterium]|nr:hypothetical protein [Candidatus Poribacteria bacterium]